MLVAGITTFAELWASHRKDVESVVCSLLGYKRNPENFAHLVAVGQEALWQASLRFVEEKQRTKAFWPFAAHRVRGAVLDELRSWDHLPRDARTKLKRGDNAAEEFGWGLVHRRTLSAAHGVPVADNPETNVERKERGTRLRKAIDALSPAQRRVAIAFLVEQKRLPEVAREMGVSTVRICQIRQAAMKSLKERMREEEP
jgi:RNA polymerase sigma factor (sigma-70 family)